MESLSLVLSLLVVVAVLAVAGACAQPNTADQLFSLAISDNSGGSKNGAPVPALKFGGETPRATTVMAKKSIPTLNGKDSNTAWGQLYAGISTVLFVLLDSR